MVVDAYELWFQKALNLAPGEKLYVPCEDKEQQDNTYRRMVTIQNKMVQAGKEEGMFVRIGKIWRDKNLWVFLARRSNNTGVGFVKRQNTEGKWVVERVDFKYSSERIRQIKLMVEDGLSFDEIEKVMGELEEEEVKMFFGR